MKQELNSRRRCWEEETRIKKTTWYLFRRMLGKLLGRVHTLPNLTGTEQLKQTPESVRTRKEAAARCTKKDLKKGAQKTSKGSQG